jgi:hypothetical protein
VAREIAEETTGGELIVRPVARDPQLAEQVTWLFTQVENVGRDGLALEESLVCCLMRVLHRHGVRGPRTACSSPSVLKAIRRLDTAPEIPTSLAELAALSGVSRFQLLRGFRPRRWNDAACLSGPTQSASCPTAPRRRSVSSRCCASGGLR